MFGVRCLGVALLAAGMGFQGSKAPTLPPEMEFSERRTYFGATEGMVFAPMFGGLNMALVNGDVSYAHTSDTGLLANLRTSEISYVSSTDLMDRQALCPTALFVRSYRSELAKLGKHSPGLPVGWVHNYDVIIKLPTGTEKWEPFTLYYPNKARENMEPELDESGKPTGKGVNLSNQTYKVTVGAGATPNHYDWICIDWPNSRTRWTFTPHSSGDMVLRKLGMTGGPMKEIRIGYLDDRSLGEIKCPDLSLSLMSFQYTKGLLSTAIASGDLRVDYSYAQVGQNTVLWTVSEPYSGGKPRDSYVYSYAKSMPYPALAQIAVPDGESWWKTNIDYEARNLKEIRSATGERQLFTPPQ